MVRCGADNGFCGEKLHLYSLAETGVQAEGSGTRAVQPGLGRRNRSWGSETGKLRGGTGHWGDETELCFCSLYASEASGYVL